MDLPPPPPDDDEALPPPPPEFLDDEDSDEPIIVTRKPRKKKTPKRKFRKRWFYLEKSTLVIYENDLEDDEPLYTIDIKNSTVYSWHYSSGHNFFCLTAKDEGYTHFFDTDRTRIRDQWLKSFHNHGAKIVQPGKFNYSGGYVRQRKDFLKLYNVGIKTNEGVCHEGLTDLLKIVNKHIYRRRIVKEAPKIDREIKSLKRQISDAHLEAELAKQNTSSAVDQMEEAKRMYQHLETSINQTQEQHEGSRIKGTALKTYREMDKLKKEREISRLLKLTAEQKKKMGDVEYEWKQLKKRVSELESQQAIVLQQTGKSIKKNNKNEQMVNVDISNRQERSFSTLFMGDDIDATSNVQWKSDQMAQENSIDENSVKKIDELSDTKRKQSAKIEELRSTQQDMKDHMLLLEKQKEELEQELLMTNEQDNGNISANVVDDESFLSYNTTDPICMELGEKIDALTKDYQKLEKFTEQITGELEDEIMELKRNCEDVEASKDEMEEAAELIISDLEEEKADLINQLEHQSGGPDQFPPTRSHSRTPTIALSPQELQNLRDENIRLKTCLQLGGDDVKEAQEEAQREREAYMMILRSVKEVKQVKYALLEDMLKQREEMDLLDESLAKKNTRIAELEQDNASLESKLVHLK